MEDLTSDLILASPTIYGHETEASVSVSSGGDTWGLFDTGATHYMFKDIKLFESSSMTKIPSDNNKLKLAGGDAKLNVLSKGTVKLKAGDGTHFEFKNCLYIPDLSRHLIAGGLLLRKGIQVIVNPSNPKCFSLVFQDKALFNGIFLDNNLMLVKIIHVSDLTSIHGHLPEAQSSEIDSKLLHLRMGHISSRYLKKMCKDGCVIGHEGVEIVNENCDVCMLSKGTKIPHSGTRPRAFRFLENVHVDLSGIIRTKGINNEIYYILFCDDYSSFRHIFPLNNKTKESVFEIFKFYIAMTERQTGCRLKQFTMDRGSEFLNDLLGSEMRRLGIIFHLTAAHTPAENGVAERGNRTITTKARSMMLEASCPLMFWFEACKTAVFLINRSMTTAIPSNVSPFELWHGRKPSVQHLRVWGYKAYSLIRKETRDSKFSPVSQEGMLVGFEEDNFNFHIYDFKTRKILITHHATFDESVFPYASRSDSTEDSALRQDAQPVNQFFDDESDSDSLVETDQRKSTRTADEELDTGVPNEQVVEESEEIVEGTSQSIDNADVRRSSRNTGSRISYRGMTTLSNISDHYAQCLSAEVIEISQLSQMFNCLPLECHSVNLDLTYPKSFSKAVSGPDGKRWMQACEKEIQAMVDRQVWKLVERPPRPTNVIRGLWLFRKKVLSDGISVKFKVRFVAMGNTQREGEDYGETFAPTGKPGSLRLITAIAAVNSWEIHQMDAVAAFLNSHLSEEIFVKQPEGFVREGDETKVCLLLRSLYGLKQSPKMWQDDVKEYLISIGFEQCEADHCT